MFARVVDCVPEPITLAWRIIGRPFPAFLSATASQSTRGRYSWLACDPDGESTSLDPMNGGGGDSASARSLAAFPRFIGVAPYEARRGLERAAWSPVEDRAVPPIRRTEWLSYPAVARVDPHEGRVLVAGVSRAAVDDLARLLATPDRAGARPEGRVEVEDDEPHETHLTRIARAIELIEAGDLYQVNLARRVRLRLVGEPTASALLATFTRLVRAAPSELGAFLVTPQGTVLSTSPELCLLAESNASCDGFHRLSTEPIKGTRPRGRDAFSDAKLAEELEADPKERAELAMIIDVERNDLHRVSVAGSVRVLGPPRVVAHRTILHRVATLSGIAREGIRRNDVLEAMLPSGSVTGAPKIRAMEVIRTLESVRRGLYTGALGYQANDGSMMLSMAIRTAVFQPKTGVGEYLVGGGIVVDSSPERELAETQWKAAQLRALLGEETM